MRKILASLAATALIAAPVAAAPPAKAKKSAKPAQPALDPDLKVAAEAVVKATGAEEAIDKALQTQSDELRTGTLVQQEVDRSPEMHEARMKNPAAWAMVMKRFGERQADTLDNAKGPVEAEYHDRLVRAYATGFTLEELKALADFYGSPLGAKLATVQPQIMAENNAWFQDRIGEKVAAQRPALAKEFHDAVAPLMAAAGDGAPSKPTAAKAGDDGR